MTRESVAGSAGHAFAHLSQSRESLKPRDYGGVLTRIPEAYAQGPHTVSGIVLTPQIRALIISQP